MKKKQHKPEEPSVLPGMQVEFICPKCGKSLAWALPVSYTPLDVYKRQVHCWTR